MTGRQSAPAAITALPERSRGAALITSLVLLLILTILATAGMRTARLELLLADNQRATQEAFAAAETGIELAIDDMLRSGRLPAGPFALTLPDGANVWVHLALKAITSPLPVSSPIRANPEDVRAFHFELRSAASTARGAQALHVQGFYLLMAGFDEQDRCLDQTCLPAIEHCADLSCFTFDPAHFPVRTYWTTAPPG